MKKDIFENAKKCHKVWHKFSSWLTKTYGSDLYGEWQYMDEEKKFKYRSFDNKKLSERLVGYDVMIKIERYCKRYLPEIKIIHCDDAVYAGSNILLIPHPGHGITIMYIPQCTTIQNQFFLYENHYENLLQELKRMKDVFKISSKEKKKDVGNRSSLREL